MSWLPDAILLKVVDSVSSRMTRPKYEELLVSLGLYSLFALRDDEEYCRLSKRDLIIRTFKERDEEKLLSALYEEGALDKDALSALQGIGYEIGQSLAGDLADPVQELSRLESALTIHGFSRVLSFLNQSLENYARGNYESSNAMARTALEHLIEQIAYRISEARGNEPIPKRGKRFSPADHRGYLRSTGFLDDSEKDFLDKFYGYASTDGSHPGVSTKAEARLRRFVVVAIALLFLEKLSDDRFMGQLT